MKKFLHNVAERIKSMREGRRSTEYRITWDEKHVRVEWVTLENETGSITFSWDSVLAVETFKRDHLTVDCICLAFETKDGWIEVNEDMKGWGDFLCAIESHLISFPPQANWLLNTMFPAFAANHLRLWGRP